MNQKILRAASLRTLGRVAASLLGPWLLLGGCAADTSAPPSEPTSQSSSALDIGNIVGNIDPDAIRHLGGVAAPVGCSSGSVQTPDADGNVVVSGRWLLDEPPGALVIANGSVPVAANGTWSKKVHASPGMNVFTVLSRDASGVVRTNMCTVYSAPVILRGDDALENGLVLGLRQGGIDDGSPNLPLKSFADAMRVALGSAGMRDMLDAELHDQIGKQHLVDGPVASWYYRYDDINFSAPELSITLENGALRVSLSVGRARISGKVVREGVFQNDAWNFDAKFSRIRAKFDLKPKLEGGQVTVETKLVGEGADLDDPSFDGDGLLGEALDDAVNLFGKALMRKAIAKGMEKGIEKTLPKTLEKLLETMGKGGLRDTNVDVPNLDGDGSTRLHFAATLSDLKITDNGMLRVAFDTKVTSPNAGAAADKPLGVPSTNRLPAHFGKLSNEECDQGTAAERRACVVEFEKESAGSVSPGVVGQAMRALWAAGFFQVREGGASLGLLRPPFVAGTSDGGVRVSAGPFATTLDIPGQGEVRGFLYTRVEIPVATSGDTGIVFGTPDVEEVRFDPAGGARGLALFAIPASIEPAIRTALTRALRRALTAVDPISIPSYKIPSSLADFGLPAGSRFGVKARRIESNAGFLTLVGSVGEL